MLRITVVCLCFFISSMAAGQSLTVPTILEVAEDDHVATISWNSLTASYQTDYDPDKREGIFSYLVEWGEVGQDFPKQQVTPYRAHQLQPLEPGINYEARISALGARGEKSGYSEVITFQHDPTRVNEMRQRLNGFFDDMNYPMGAFDEERWNQSYSGCMKLGHVSQHINNQYHGHNVIASNGTCDRAFASSRAREVFDFRDRTGTIEFDLDGVPAARNHWYLDLTPATRKNDVTGHINNVGEQSDPAFLLRIEQVGHDVRILLADANGILRRLENVYENSACGDDMRFCEDKSLVPLINVRRHWKIELSKTRIQIHIDDILVVDGSLLTPEVPEGLPYEIAQVNWTMFVYNTSKAKLIMSMVHWDNFGFDAPDGFVDSEVIHNYSDGNLGTETPRIGNGFSIGMVPRMDEPAIAIIPTPDALTDQMGNGPLETELMFTLQGARGSWTGEERIEVNGHLYPFVRPISAIPDFNGRLLGPAKPYSAILDLDPTHLMAGGNNEIAFYLEQHRILNVHIELTFPTAQAPAYTAPNDVFADHHSKLMSFRSIADSIGPAIGFSKIDESRFGTDEFERVTDPTPEIDYWYVKQTPVEGEILLTMGLNSLAQMAATGTAKGITHYEISMDGDVIHTVRTDEGHPIAVGIDSFWLDTRAYSNGPHELFIQAYDTRGISSYFDSRTGSKPGSYLPTILDIQNETTNHHVLALDESISIYPNPTGDFFRVQGDLDQYDMTILRADGSVYQEIDSVDDSTAVNVSQLPQGVYFIRLIHVSNQKLSVQKMIKS